MRKRSVFIVLVAIVVLTEGCYHYRISMRGEAATEPHKKTMHALFWGLVQENQFADNCQGKGIHEVRVSTNFGYVLVSVVTVGIWVPMDIEWSCAREAPPDSSVFK
jgi:hypothetical protein